MSPFFRVAAIAAAFFSTANGNAMPAGQGADPRSYNLAHGRVVFEQRCMRCHESGRKGAPVLGDVKDWRDRVEQPLGTLINHAINGHRRMPARGDQEISDQDVAAAVAFVVDRTRSLIAQDLESLPATASGDATESTATPDDDAVVRMFLLLYGKDRWR